MKLLTFRGKAQLHSTLVFWSVWKITAFSSELHNWKSGNSMCSGTTSANVKEENWIIVSHLNVYWWYLSVYKPQTLPSGQQPVDGSQSLSEGVHEETKQKYVELNYRQDKVRVTLQDNYKAVFSFWNQKLIDFISLSVRFQIKPIQTEDK